MVTSESPIVLYTKLERSKDTNKQKSEIPKSKIKGLT